MPKGPEVNPLLAGVLMGGIVVAVAWAVYFLWF
jgi:hypothetical protein